jgi:hypothetical protein
MRLIDGDALLEKFAKLEAIALEYVGKLNERQDPNEHDMWVMWTGILNERTAYKYEIADAPTVEATPKWIPCSERLPEDDRTKVVTLANGNAEAGYYSNGDWWCVGDSINLENPKVIAWMPLPKPYEVDE